MNHLVEFLSKIFLKDTYRVDVVVFGSNSGGQINNFNPSDLVQAFKLLLEKDYIILKRSDVEAVANVSKS